jgi:hypothetical protein
MKIFTEASLRAPIGRRHIGLAFLIAMLAAAPVAMARSDETLPAGALTDRAATFRTSCTPARRFRLVAAAGMVQSFRLTGRNLGDVD